MKEDMKIWKHIKRYEYRVHTKYSFSSYWHRSIRSKKRRKKLSKSAKQNMNAYIVVLAQSPNEILHHLIMVYLNWNSFAAMARASTRTLFHFAWPFLSRSNFIRFVHIFCLSIFGLKMHNWVQSEKIYHSCQNWIIRCCCCRFLTSDWIENGKYDWG